MPLPHWVGVILSGGIFLLTAHDGHFPAISPIFKLYVFYTPFVGKYIWKADGSVMVSE